MVSLPVQDLEVNNVVKDPGHGKHPARGLAVDFPGPTIYF